MCLKIVRLLHIIHVICLDTVEGSTVEIKVGVEGNVDEDIQEDIQTYMIYVHREGTKSALLTTKLEDLPGVSALTLADKNAVVEARVTYNELTDAQKEALAKDFAFEYWGEAKEGKSIVRFCTSWATNDAQIKALTDAIAAL